MLPIIIPENTITAQHKTKYNHKLVCSCIMNCTQFDIGSSRFPFIVEGFTVADAILVVGQTQQNLQWMYGKNHDFDAGWLEEGWHSTISLN